MSRPSDFTEEIADKILSRLMEGESLRAICRDDDMPARSTVHLWVLNHEQFSDRYARARVLQAEMLFEETLEIADDGSNDYMVKSAKGGEEFETLNSEHVQRSRLRVDTRKWFIAKLVPNLYGDKVSHEHSGRVDSTVSWVVDASDPADDSA